MEKVTIFGDIEKDVCMIERNFDSFGQMEYINERMLNCQKGVSVYCLPNRIRTDINDQGRWGIRLDT